MPKRLSSAGNTLNSRKCEFYKTSLTFLGHIIDQRGITADPNKPAAIQQMETPKSVSELHRFLGMVNQLGKFSPNIAELSKPLQELLSAKKAWLWTPTQDKDFTNLKRDLTTPNILTMYDPSIGLYVTGYWKTDHNVTLGQLHFIGPANSHTHALSMHCCITGLS